MGSALGTSHLHQTEVRAMNADGGVKAGSQPLIYPFQGAPQFSQSYMGAGKSKQASKSHGLWNGQCPAASTGTQGKNAQPYISMEPWLGDSPSWQWGNPESLCPSFTSNHQSMPSPVGSTANISRTPQQAPRPSLWLSHWVSASISFLPPWLPPFHSSEK